MGTGQVGRLRQGQGRHGSYRVTFTVLTAAIGAYALLQSMVVPVLTTMQAQLHTSQDTATWILTAYLLSAAICTPILGRVGDIYGKGRVFVAALIALAQSGVLLSGGHGDLSGKLLRIGHMGPSAFPLSAVIAVTATGRALHALGIKADIGTAVEAALEAADQD